MPLQAQIDNSTEATVLITEPWATWSAKHPTLAPLESAPFYAVRIVTGDLGSAKGLVTEAQARVLNTEGRVIPGLYAIGTDMNSPMGGTYPGPGIVLGTGLTFGYIAARSIIDGHAR